MAGLACLGLILTSKSINAQTVSDFESQTLAPNSFTNGSDLSGTHNSGLFSLDFSDGDAIFPNLFDTTFGSPGYWSGGFGISNMTDSTTSGSGNLSSSRAGSGVHNSSNYLISNNNSKIHLTNTATNNTVSGIYITNSTYAANSMRDGDTFAKQFGSSNDANGNPDGTNGEDWFLLTIWGYTGGNLTTDSINFYLADYRFADNSQDYILKDWQWVDLSSLGNIDSLIFSLNSSDVGAFGMNTPSFFALDNFNDQTISVSELSTKNSFSIYPNPAKESISIKLEETANSLQIIDVSGRVVFERNNLIKGIHKMNLTNLNSGIYFVKITNDNETKVERLIKQ